MEQPLILRPGERITDEAKFLAANQARVAGLTGKAQAAYQNNLDTYHELKKKQKS